MYLEIKQLKLLKRVRSGMRKPELLHTSPMGATIHSYDLEGGKTTFERFLGCYKGNCVFYNTYDEARTKVSEGWLHPTF